MGVKKYISLIMASLVTMAASSHIDDVDKELTNFKFDQVIFRLKKDCSLDRQPEVPITFNLLMHIVA